MALSTSPVLPVTALELSGALDFSKRRRSVIEARNYSSIPGGYSN